jgi:hypothetical protein
MVDKSDRFHLINEFLAEKMISAVGEQLRVVIR